MIRRNTIKGKLVLRFSGIFIFLFLVIQLVVLFNFRKSAIESSRLNALTVAELVRDSLTSLMMLGQMQNREIFLNQIKSTQGLRDVRIIRAQPVIEQFGPPLNNEVPEKDLEFEVLKTGEMKSRLSENMSEAVYELVIPYKAEPDNKVNCLACHKVKQGSVLGAVSLTLDLTRQRYAGSMTLTTVAFVSLIFFAGTIYMLFIFFKPYSGMFEKLKKSFDKVSEGDFTEQIEVTLDDEAGDVARNFDRMLDRLSGTLGNVRHKVATLIGYKENRTGNDLKDTREIVSELLKIFTFKKTIDQDKKTKDIYTRLATVFSDMGLEEFTFFEVKSSQNTMTEVLSYPDKTDYAKRPICNDVIYRNAEECRGARTGREVDSEEFPCVCVNYEHPDLTRQHHCLPVMIGGHVGLMVRITYAPEDSEKIHDVVPYIETYLREAAPVIEARQLMTLLKQQSLVDQLTGLHNRRFLDEIADKISAQTSRRKSSIGILMVDVDFFKQVNDTYGHDAGDRVLTRICEVIKKTVRQADIVVRFGGEEILVLLVDVELGYAMQVAEKVRQRIENEEIQIKNGTLKKTVSIGVSEYPDDIDKLWHCIKYSDVALYEAKATGRNKVVRFNPKMWKDKEY